MQKKTRTHYYLCLAAAILVGFILRIVGKDFVSRDMEYCLLQWYDVIKEMDWRTALTTQVGDYNMLYQLIVFLLTRLPGEAILQYKAVSVLFDVVLSAGVFVWLNDCKGKKAAGIGAATVFLLPTVWMNSGIWGQCDSIYVAFIIWALFFLYKKKYIRSFLLVGVALAFKFQTVFILPFYGYLYIEQMLENGFRIYRKDEISILHFLLIPLAHIGTALPNLLAGRPILDLIKVYLSQADTYHEMSMNYPSIWCLLPFEYDKASNWAIWIAFLVLCASMFWLYRIKGKMTERFFLWGAFLLSYTCVLFLPAMHERYGFLYEILAVLLVIQTGSKYMLPVALQIISTITYAAYLYQFPENLQLLSICNLAVYLICMYAFYLEVNGKEEKIALFWRKKECEIDNDEIGKEKYSLRLTRNDYLAMAALFLGFFTIGILNLGSRHVPESFTTLGTQEGLQSEIILSFDYFEDFSSVQIYLGGDS